MGRKERLVHRSYQIAGIPDAQRALLFEKQPLLTTTRCVNDGAGYPRGIIVAVLRFRGTDSGIVRIDTRIKADELVLTFWKPYRDFSHHFWEERVTYRSEALVHHIPSRPGANAGHYVVVALSNDGEWVRYDDSVCAVETNPPAALTDAGCVYTYMVRYRLVADDREPRLA